MRPFLSIPSESQWEIACRSERSDNEIKPFHFGTTIDSSWANYNATVSYGLGRKGQKAKQQVVNGYFGLVNRLGFAEMHGQMLEWCSDLWQRDPTRRLNLASQASRTECRNIAGILDGSSAEQPDPELKENPEQNYRLQRGGSWFYQPILARAAYRCSNFQASVDNDCGFRPCCSLCFE
jgi:formylglycine-generating enzyme required for sulfatase activity